ncbi:type II secretion system protein GspM [Methylophilus sp. 3sh_L]|uniref:type II secretion system protein GspM n=1 Tax=Methylophilus sp. 3sh_L TaxID=3377114 RepID=UPI00398E8E9F
MMKQPNSILRLSQWWQNASSRERSLVLTAILVLSLYLGSELFTWATTSRERLLKNVPKTEMKLKQIQEAVNEMSKLKSEPVLVPPRNDTLLNIVKISIQSHGLNVTVAQSGNELLMKGSVNFNALIEWLAIVQKDYALRIQRMKITRENEGTMVNLSLIQFEEV